MRISISWISEIRTPLTCALSHMKNGTKWKNMLRATMMPTAIKMDANGSSMILLVMR